MKTVLTCTYIHAAFSKFDIKKGRKYQFFFMLILSMCLLIVPWVIIWQIRYILSMYTRYTIHACLRSDNYCCCFENDPHLSLFCLVMMSSSKNSVLCVQSVKVMNQLLAPLDPPFPSSSSPSPQKALLPDQMQTKITLGQAICSSRSLRKNRK